MQHQSDKCTTAKVKVQCLRLLVTLKLDPARMHLISGFIDAYLRLSTPEKRQFEEELGSIGAEEKEAAMQIVTSWMEEGIEQGLQQGVARQAGLVMRWLRRYLGELPAFVEPTVRSLPIESLENLGESILRDWEKKTRRPSRTQNQN